MVRRTVTRLALAAISIAVLWLPAAAGAASPRAIAAALRHGSVYASPAASPALSGSDARRVEAEIARRDRGRIKIAIVSHSEARAAGGLAGLANSIDRRLDAPGTVLVHEDHNTWLVTAYPDSQTAQSAVRQAFTSNRRLVDQLRESVTGIATVDPGPQAKVEVPPVRIPPVRIPSFPRIPATPPASSGGGSSTAATIAIVLGTAAPFLIVGLIVLRRSWRARREAHETLEDDLADAKQQLVALGDDIGELDLDVEMPNADAAGKREYEQALEQYQRAERLLGEDASVRRLARANSALAEGRRLMDAARAHLERERA